MKKKYYSWSDIEKMCIMITHQMYADMWRPDYIVGITRGGNVPATIISSMLNIPAETINVSFRDYPSQESVCWMAEDAFGYGHISDGQGNHCDGSVETQRKKILIIDDINESGRTFDWIIQDWQSLCLPNDPAWNDIWGQSVRFAVITENLASDFDLVTYYGDTVNKVEEPVWLEYPWSNVGKYGGRDTREIR